MTGLGDLLDGADKAAGRAVGDARLGAEGHGAVHTRVRRAHARRSAFRTSLVAIAVVVLGAAGIYGVGRLGTKSGDVAADAPVSSSATAAASPSVTPSETAVSMPDFAGTVTVDAHLPGASAITPEVWASAEPGWSLVSYQERWFDGESVEGAGPQVVYLASPTGVLYELTTVTGDTVGVLAWDLGATTAAVSVQPESEMAYMGVLDLASGEVERVGDYAPYLWSLAFLDADGEPVWTGSDWTPAYVTVASDGTYSGYEIPASEGAADLVARLDGTDCNVAAPYSESTSIVVCDPGASGWPTKIALAMPVDEGVEPLGPVDGALGQPSRAGHYVVVPLGEDVVDACPSTYVALLGSQVLPVPGADDGLHPHPSSFVPFGAVDGQLVWGVTNACFGTTWPYVVVSSDIANGDYSVLVPYPGARPAGEEPYVSVTGVAVGR